MAGVEFQVFEGVSCDLHPWISTLEDQFARADYSDMDKLALTVYFLGGKAESFVHQREEIKYFETWDELKSSLIRMFGERDDPERIRLQTERDISTHNWLVSLKVRNADAIQEMPMPISSVSESQVESASVPAKLLDEHRIIPQNESIQVLHPNLESSLTSCNETLNLIENCNTRSASFVFVDHKEDLESTDSGEPSESEPVPVSLTYSSLDMDSTVDTVSKHEVQSLEAESVQENNNITTYMMPQLASEHIKSLENKKLGVWIPPKVEYVYVLDVEMVEELIQKPEDANTELVARHLFDLLLQRVVCKRKQLKCHKSWKFKYKMEDLWRFLRQNGRYTSMRVKHQTSKSLCVIDHVGSLEKRSTCGRWRSQQQSSFVYKLRSWLGSLRKNIKAIWRDVVSLEEKRWFTKVDFLCFLGEKFWSIQQEVHEGNFIVQRAGSCVARAIPSSSVCHHWMNKIEMWSCVVLLLKFWFSTWESLLLCWYISGVYLQHDDALEVECVVLGARVFEVATGRQQCLSDGELCDHNVADVLTLVDEAEGKNLQFNDIVTEKEMRLQQEQDRVLDVTYRILNIRYCFEGQQFGDTQRRVGVSAHRPFDPGGIMECTTVSNWYWPRLQIEDSYTIEMERYMESDCVKATSKATDSLEDTGVFLERDSKVHGWRMSIVQRCVGGVTNLPFDPGRVVCLHNSGELVAFQDQWKWTVHQSRIAHALLTVVGAWVLVVGNVSIDEAADESLGQKKCVYVLRRGIHDFMTSWERRRTEDVIVAVEFELHHMTSLHMTLWQHGFGDGEVAQGNC